MATVLLKFEVDADTGKVRILGEETEKAGKKAKDAQDAFKSIAQGIGIGIGIDLWEKLGGAIGSVATAAAEAAQRFVETTGNLADLQARTRSSRSPPAPT
jgi:hypothetical protein